MDTERWSTLSALLDEMLELEPPARARRLAEITAGDAGLADELKKMIALEDERPDFLANSVVDAALFAPQAGQSIGPYKLERPLGEGGMGQVWLALRADGLYQRRVALKLLRPGLGDAGLRNRFTRERQILARLGHAHIARLLDAGVSSDGQPYLALDYVQGEPITQYARQLALSTNDRLRLFLQVCAAVSHAHANLVVHRDLKPSNILVTSAGEVCLLDFGIAKLLDEPVEGNPEITGTGTRAFTLHYAAPEQLRNGVITTMTDVYSLGVVLYELLTGRKPYDPARTSDAAWEEAILTGDPVRPSVGALKLARESGVAHPRRVASELAGDLDNILLKALAKAPDDRYVSVEALAQDLRRHMDGEPVLARPQSLGYRAQKFLRRNALAISVGTSVTTVLVVALLFVSWQARKALSEADRAQAMQDFVVALFENTDQAGSGTGLDVRTLLDAGVRRADTELLGQPQARAELLGLVARLRQGLGDDRQALELLDRQSQVLSSVSGEAPARIGIEAAALRGRSLRALGQPEVCERALMPWMKVSEEQATRHPREVSEFLSQLGRCHRSLGGGEVARDLFSSALALRSGPGLSKALQAESQADLASLLADEGKYAQAITGMRAALGLLRESGGDRNALGVEIWRDLGGLHRAIGDPLESEASYRQALEIALNRFGPGHPASTGVQRPLGAILVEAGKLEEADRLLRTAHDRLLARFGPEHPEVASSWQQMGRLAWEQGQLPLAQDAFQRSLQLRRRSNELGLRGSVLCDLAQVRLALGQADSAELLAHECQQIALATDALLAARADGLLADVAMARGNSDAAQALLSSAQQRLLAAGLAADDLALESIALARVQALLVARDFDGAENGLQGLLAAPRVRTPEAEQGLWRIQALQARWHCLRGDDSAARVVRDRMLAEASARQPERQRLLDELAATAACR
ncbi:protein kinase domain-containing protein [Arenimonas sp. MALMAid1274]|uniref:protein kinase domain-containing protein n=1 Tax=Arenimonas sp. MALMAid1274 TaxID=3411630 RepID=UPI003B9EBF35